MKCRACVLGLSFVVAVCIAESASAYYNTSLGRFVSRDPIGYRGSKWNLYEYVGGRPLTLTDSSGLKPKGDPKPGPVWEEPTNTFYCEFLIKEGYHKKREEKGKVVLGFVMCFGEKAVRCLVDNNIKKLYTTERGRRLVKDCGAAHEQAHTQQLDCSRFLPGVDPCWGHKPDYLPGFETEAQRECDASTQELACYRKALGLKGDEHDADVGFAIQQYCRHNFECELDIERALIRVKDAISENCPKKGKPPKTPDSASSIQR